MSGALTELRATGRVMLPSLTAGQMADIHAYLNLCPVYADAHVPITALRRNQQAVLRHETDSECICIPVLHAIMIPHIFEYALGVTEIAAAYLQCEVPMMYSANAFWTRPGQGPIREDIQALHCDYDDTRFLTMFVFLTDADFDAAQELEGPDGVVQCIGGRAGTVFLADTSRPHRGRKPLLHERGLAWIRWGVTENPAQAVADKLIDWHAYTGDETQPISAAYLGWRYPTDPRLQQSIKLLVTP